MEDVKDEDEVADDVVRDLHEVIVSMCARLYGKRSAKHRAQKALDALNADALNADAPDADDDEQ